MLILSLIEKKKRTFKLCTFTYKIIYVHSMVSKCLHYILHYIINRNIKYYIRWYQNVYIIYYII